MRAAMCVHVLCWFVVALHFSWPISGGRPGALVQLSILEGLIPGEWLVSHAYWPMSGGAPRGVGADVCACRASYKESG